MKIMLNIRNMWYLLLIICSLNVATAAEYSQAFLDTHWSYQDDKYTPAPDEVTASFHVYPTEDVETVRAKFELYKPGDDVPYIVAESDWEQIEDAFPWYEYFGAKFELVHSGTSRGFEALGAWSIKSYIDIAYQGWELIGEDELDLLTILPARYEYETYLSKYEDGSDSQYPHLPNNPTNVFYTSAADDHINASLHFYYYHQDPAIGVDLKWFYLFESSNGQVTRYEVSIPKPTWSNAAEFSGEKMLMSAFFTMPPIKWVADNKVVGKWEVDYLINDIGGGDTDFRVDKTVGFEIIDDVKPKLSITTPGGSSTDTYAYIYGKTSDDVEVVKMTWSNNQGGAGEITDYDMQDWVITGIHLKDGVFSENVITVIAYDAAGNQSVPASVTIDLDYVMDEEEAYNRCPEYVPGTDPIDAFTGGQILKHNLLTAQGLIPLSFRLYYDSKQLKEGVVGYGWEESKFRASLDELDNGDVRVRWSTNRSNKFIKQDDGQYEAAHFSCQFDKLVKYADGSFIATRKNQKAYEFDTAGKLLTIGNQKGQVIQLNYDVNGVLINITEPVSGVFLDYTYQDDLLTKITDPLGRQVLLGYDDEHNLTTITDAAGQVITYTYGENGQIITGTNNEGIQLFKNIYDGQRITVQEDSNGQEVKIAYDSTTTTVTDRLNKTRTYTFNDDRQLLSLVDELGHETVHTYDDNAQRTSTTDANGNTTGYIYDTNGNLQTLTDAANHITNFVYDDDNNLRLVTNALSKQIKFSYENNLLKTMTDSLDNVTSYTYNADGQVLTKTSPKGGVITYEYVNGLPTKVTNPENGVSILGYDAVGRLETVTDVDGNTTTLVYDGVDRLKKVINPLNHEVSMTYDSRNNLRTFTDANGNVTRRDYNNAGKLISQTNALNEVTTYEYDDNSRLVKIIDALEHVTKLSYDDSGRLQSVTNPLGQTQTLEYDAADNLLKRFDALGKRETLFKYDELNNPVKVTDALENSSSFEYDELNRLVESVDPLNRVTQFDYDDLNRLESSVDALQGESKQGFDADGNQVSLTDPNSNETKFDFDLNGNLVQETLATEDKVKYSYNAKDLLKTVTNGRQQQRTFEYDVLGRLESWSDPDGSVAYTYDNNGNVLTVVDASGTITREFDALNRVVKYTDARNNVLQYAYDSVGNLVGLTYPDGKLVSYDYDAAEQLVKVTDWASRVTVYDYDKNGRLISTLRPNGTQMARSYDDAGQLLRQDDVVSFEFSYDAAGNIVAERTNHEADPDINLEMSYQAANRLATVDNEAVEFDADGNMLSGGVNRFDSRNRLIQADSVIYHYDAENQRISVDQINYVVNSQPALSQVLVQEENDQKTFYVYGLGLIGQETDGKYLSYHYDFRGSTVALSDSSGQVTESFQYSPYGLLLSGDSSKTPFLFNGMYGVMTDSNNLYYMRARFYSPEIKRFINQDILLGSIDEGQTLNRYVYTTGNPISKIDPTGRWVWIVLPVCSGGGCEFIAGSLAYGITWFAINEGVYNNIYDEGGRAKTQSPYSKDEEREALRFSPDPFGGDEACKRLRNAIRVLRARIKWRKTDLNNRSNSYKGHVIRIALLSGALAKLELAYQSICGGNCPS